MLGTQNGIPGNCISALVAELCCVVCVCGGGGGGGVADACLVL